MSNQFKPGDLAIIVGANSLTQNIGKQCELREFVTSGDFYVAPNGEVYRHDDVPCWTLVGDGLVAVVEGEVVDLDFGIHEPRHLMPLRDDFASEQQKVKEAQPA
ncbi:Uncharacterized protein ALO68_03874 [Pseudomonas syringae pv. helianthi]|uniref:Uncharacterized protein n=1 Tax=Pseudomonas syringae pv. helianthi TaxID=251654 RepID=A0A0P9RHD3_9PSED|nr:hypothetical protein [Pseudomonas syringae group genomosp. 7]KPX44812.1 Uncharacterized protein ALO68_03874 [Pseudomonas syringae pv. helianthi]UNB61863.1 hypothetical protein MME54_19825 [Pseudomonas syringae pv. helianthi]